MKDEVLTGTAAVPGLSARGPQIAGAVQSGQIGNVIARLPGPARQVVGTITRAAFTTGLDRILVAGGMPPSLATGGGAAHGLRAGVVDVG